MSESSHEIDIVSFDHDDLMTAGVSYDMSLDSLSDDTDWNQFNIDNEWRWYPKTQLDLFDRLIESQSLAASSLFALEGEDNVESAADYHISSKEYLQDCKALGWLRVTFDEESQHHQFWFVGSDVDYTWWKMKWSEYFDQSFQFGIQI